MSSAGDYTEICIPGWPVLVGDPGRSPWKTNAKRNARIKWRNDVRIRFGSSFTEWEWARKVGPPELGATEVGYACHKKWWGWTCRAIAVPCKREY